MGWFSFGSRVGLRASHEIRHGMERLSEHLLSVTRSIDDFGRSLAALGTHAEKIVAMACVAAVICTAIIMGPKWLRSFMGTDARTTLEITTGVTGNSTHTTLKIDSSGQNMAEILRAASALTGARPSPQVEAAPNAQQGAPRGIVLRR
ncbi:hypothetical protein DFH27DRAFT_656860 [Peziza echinospora]|nr:hypothetical protein DFH27DRAFT_656860 [Peziza echinospora]